MENMNDEIRINWKKKLVGLVFSTIKTIHKNNKNYDIIEIKTKHDLKNVKFIKTRSIYI